MREEKLSQCVCVCVREREREREAVEIIFMFLGFTFSVDSISEEVVGFSPFMVSLRINNVFIVSCV